MSAKDEPYIRSLTEYADALRAALAMMEYAILTRRKPASVITPRS